MSDKTQTSPLVQPAPPIAADLVRRFGDHIDAYKSGRCNETQLRREFIDPLFRGLGWDVDNEQGYAEAYKDVIHEAAVRVEGAVKAPDYSFRIGGVRKFFLEAKKPSINIKGDPGPAYQLRRYAWSAKLPLSILTDFEEFAVYDCRTRPVKTDSPATARVLYLKYTDYLARWGEIASIFSREAILTGSFDKYVESKKRKRGTAEVDAAFLQEIEGWRETLARNLALRNAALTQRQLNFAVQVTVDRIIFLRMCEDRGIEDYARLMALLNGDRVYDRLMQLFREADQRYNSGLFHFQREPGRADPDELTPGLTIDDRILKDIIKGLYYPDSPYEFSVLPADILGHVYEQFLGKVIRLTSGHRAKVEEKPEVRKAGGVYYTPTYIVQYIVKHTVGKLLGPVKPRPAVAESSEARTVKWVGKRKGKTINQPQLDKPLRVLDPACGSGSFLLGAYQYLLDWHLDYYTTHDPEKWARKRNPPIYLRSNHLAPGDSPGANYRLTVAERKRILVDHIFGVDIDTQAVEVTKLSLLLKVLEGETTHSLGTHLWYEKERALPDLASNIKCGNSLIGPDFYDTSGAQMDMFDEEERYRINVFDWPAEFPDVFKATPASRGVSPRRTSKRKDPNEPADDSQTTPGFDAVIGNPPYVRIQTTVGTENAYLSQQYEAATGNFDIYCLFLERGLMLLNHDGTLGLIVPHRFFKTEYGCGVREFITKKASIREIIDFDGFMVFEGASINTSIVILEHVRRDTLRYSRITDHSASIEQVRRVLFEDGSDSIVDRGVVDTRTLKARPWTFVRAIEEQLWSRLNGIETKLTDFTDQIFQGLKTGADRVFVGTCVAHDSGPYVSFRSQVDDRVYQLDAALVYPLAKGGQMRRFALHMSNRCIIFPYREGVLPSIDEMEQDYALTLAYLRDNRDLLESRDRGRMKCPTWYGYSRNQALQSVHRPKLLVPDYYAHASFCFDATGSALFCGGGAGGYGIIPRHGVHAQFILGCLNSRTVDWYLQKISMRAYQTAFMYTKKYLVRLPIRAIDLSNSVDKSRHDRMVALVQQMLDLHKQLAAAKTAHEKTALQRQIDATDRQIDQLVYDLYALTDDEIRIVEEATQ